MTDGPDSRFVRSERHVSAPLADEQALLDLDTGVYYGLNPTGVLIWSLLERPRTLAELVPPLRDAFSVPSDVAQADAEAFLGALVEAGLARSLPPID